MNGNTVRIGQNIVVLTEGTLATGSNIYVGLNSPKVSLLGCSEISVGDGCEKITMNTCSEIKVAGGAQSIKLTDCSDISINSDVDDFEAVGLVGPLYIDSSYNGLKIIIGAKGISRLSATADSPVAVGTYEYEYGDTTGGNIIYNLPDPTLSLDLEFFFKKAAEVTCAHFNFLGYLLQ